MTIPPARRTGHLKGLDVIVLTTVDAAQGRAVPGQREAERAQTADGAREQKVSGDGRGARSDEPPSYPELPPPLDPAAPAAPTVPIPQKAAARRSHKRTSQLRVFYTYHTVHNTDSRAKNQTPETHWTAPSDSRASAPACCWRVAAVLARRSVPERRPRQVDPQSTPRAPERAPRGVGP